MTTDTQPIPLHHFAARLAARYGSSVGNCKDKLAAEIERYVLEREQAAFQAGVIKGAETVGQVMEMLRRSPRETMWAELDDVVADAMRGATP